MAAKKPTNYVRRKGVRVMLSPDQATPAFVTIKDHISGSVTINDSRNTVTVREFGTDYSDFDLMYTDGRTGTVSLTVNMVPSDPGYDAIYDLYQANGYGLLFIEALDENTTPTGHTWKYNVQVSQFNATLNVDNVSQVSVTFIINSLGTFTTPTA